MRTLPGSHGDTRLTRPAYRLGRVGGCCAVFKDRREGETRASRHEGRSAGAGLSKLNSMLSARRRRYARVALPDSVDIPGRLVGGRSAAPALKALTGTRRRTSRVPEGTP